MGRARTCFRAATAIDTSTLAVIATVRELETVSDAQDVVQALRQAEAALVRARDAVQAALQARKLTPENREASYGFAS